MIVDFLSPADSRWRRFTDRAPHDVYHLAEYACVASKHEGGEAVAFYVEETDHALLMPLLVRGLPAELCAPASWCDAISPYGYPGPIATKGFPSEILADALLSFRTLARERDIVSAFVRFNPFRSIPTSLFDGLGVIVNHGPVVYIDLAKSVDEWWAETRTAHRQDIARLIRSAYTVDMDDWDAYPAFRELYRITMQRLAASPFYYFSDEYFDDLRRLLGDRLHLCTVRSPAGDVAAGGLFMLDDGIVAYHLSGTAESHRAKAPTKLMIDFARRWAKEQGASLLNLGGGFGGSGSSLHHFKTGFSRSQTDFQTARIVFDHDRYDCLTAARRELHPITDDASNVFFPSYRQPYTADDA